MSKTTLSTQLPRKAAHPEDARHYDTARLRRDLSISQIAERAACSTLTVMRIERGTSTVAIGAYIRVLFALGLDDSITALAKEDEVGRTLQDLDLKHRQRASRQI